ncbi:unnamed protein product [Phyllotreta striolata]|uniref:Nose resistant-to-fluoxetine protein N-terminal domain-containing protein n=1 Tax=Phyllotreta striolata TaxID=444603 RepID=A0A9N9XJE0_PHYSR|nr:unnamed protein product [Phyllotreta striolata]
MDSLTNAVIANMDLNNMVESIIGRIDREKIKVLPINTMCALQVDSILNNTSIFTKMSDASAKFPYAGMLDSGRMELGNFDECVNIDQNIKGINILGKYCLAGLVIPDVNDTSNIDKMYKLATCVPDACSAKDLLTLANALLVEDFPPIITDNFCSTKYTGKELTAGTLFSMFLFFLLASLVLISSVCDVYCKRMNKKLHPLLLAFSAVTNTKNILKTSSDSSGENIQIFHGFRAVSIAWIISGHAVQIFVNGVYPLMNLDELQSLIKDRLATVLLAATLAVTTYFYMSGFLLGYLYFKRSFRNWSVQVKQLPYLYLHRYIRLTAPLLLVYIFTINIFEKLGTGPLWYTGTQLEINKCKKYWWSYFLYIQNYSNWDEMCLIPLWYVSADMQLFLIAPLVLIPISIILNRPNGFLLAMLTLGAMNSMFVFLIIGIRELFPETIKNTFDTHGRLADYFIGLMMGIFMRFKKDEPFLGDLSNKSKLVINFLTWTMVLVVMFCLFFFYGEAAIQFGATDQTLYYAFSRAFWAIGLSWMTYSCYHGYGGFINSILTMPVFQILGKLNYSMYILHYLVLGHYTFSNRVKWFYTHYNQFYLFCGYYVETLGFSFVWSLIIESPIIMIEKFIFRGISKVGTSIANNKKQKEKMENHEL